jgi:hypothetical protein
MKLPAAKRICKNGSRHVYLPQYTVHTLNAVCAGTMLRFANGQAK